MQTRNLASSRRKGFTAIEVIIVLSLAVIIGGTFLIVGMDSFRANAFHSDRHILISSLQRARAQAMNNICLGTNCIDSKPHGVKILTNSYVIFQGQSYLSRDTALDHVLESSPLVAQGGLDEIVFTQLSGTTSAIGDITLVDAAGHNSTVSINAEGRISWTN
jgi:prepilin-type N-terminal cleavage/methylation domain-containing protein